VAISFIGAGAQAVSYSSGASVTAAWPSGFTAVANDVAVLIGAGRHNVSADSPPTTPANWTPVATSFREIGSWDLQLAVWVKVLSGGESAPVLTVPSTYSTNSGGLAAQVAVFRGVNTSTLQDATAVPSNQAANLTWTPTGITTATDGAWVLSIVVSADNNELTLSSAQGFTARMSGTDYDTTAGSDLAVGLATLPVDTAGTPTMPTWQQPALGPDAWVSITMALRPLSASTILPIIQSYAMRRR